MTSKKAKLLKETYDKFIQISISDLSMEGMEEFIDQKIMGYGTTVDEKVLTIDDFRELLNRQREQGKDIKMTFEITSVFHRMGSDGNSALFVDEILFSIHIENNPIEMFLRLSTLIEFQKEKWVVVHWHGSKPEYAEGKTDTWHINEWQQKEKELEKLVAEKTAELEMKNKELEIEASLERVRAVAIGMLKTNELMNVAIILHKEIKLLGFTDVRNTMFNIFNDEKEKFLNYDYSDYGVSGINEVSYNSHTLNKKFVNKMRKVDKAFMMTELTGNDLDEWRKWRISEGQKTDSKLDKANSIYYYEYSIDKGSIGISTFEPITEEQLEILQKFRNVFNLAYQHFSDLKKAEAQAREAQIEAALERVRSKAMAMYSSEDLALTIDCFFYELKNLNVKPIRCGVGIKDGNSRIVDVTVTSATENGKDIKLTGKLSLGGHPILDKVYDALQLQEEYFPVLHGEEINEYYQAMNADIEFPNYSKDDVQYGYYFHYNEGGIFAWTEKELLEDEINIFRRFKSVLSLTYRRYLDLKEAEAQAREAQIELSLERIRAQAMAMKESADLLDIVVTMRSEFVALGHEAHYFWHMRWQPKMYEKAMTSGDGTRVGMVMDLPRDFHGNKAMIEWEKNDEPVAVFPYDAEGAVDYVDRMIQTGDFHKIDRNAPEPDDIRAIGGITFIMARTTHGEIGYSLPGVVTDPPAKDLSTLVRFAGAFDLAYKRFEDLKEAEVQYKIIQAENERKTRELEEARELQLAMLPKELPKLSNLDIAVYMQTATEVGGDYYDFHVEDDGTLTAVIGDATGHGMKAGTIVTITKSLFHSLASEKDILSSFSEISRVIKGMNFQQLSMCLMMLKFKDNNLSISSAAMPPALIYRNKDKSVEELSFQGMPLGAMKNFPYEQKETNLHSGDTIFLFSDGLPELINNEKEMYGYDRTKSEFLSVGEKDPEEIVNHFKNSASEWVDGKAPEDDVTFVVIKVK